MLEYWDGEETRIDMRWTLFNWLYDVSAVDAMNLDPCCRAPSCCIVDRVVKSQFPHMKKHTLQLVGMSALFISVKLFNRLSPYPDDFVEYGNHKFNTKQLLEMEKEILTTIGFDLFSHTSFTTNMPMVSYLIDLSFLDECMYGISVEEIEQAYGELCVKRRDSPVAKCLLLALKREQERQENSIVTAVYRKYIQRIPNLKKQVAGIVECRVIITRSKSRNMARISWLHEEEPKKRLRQSADDPDFILVPNNCKRAKVVPSPKQCRGKT